MKIGRNDPCPCGSGKKHKKCCINKLSETAIKQMYLEQLELTKGLKDEKYCYDVIRIGEQIISNNQDSVCLTGTYVNMAVAKRVLYYLHHDILDINDAKAYCLRALVLKQTNQAALKIMYGICLELKDYPNAYLALEEYEDRNIFSPMSMQIVEEYQNAIEIANRSDYSEEIKNNLDNITNMLFDKFGMNAGLCAVAISFYLGVGNDVLKAYELGKRSVEEYPNAITFNSLGWVCLNPAINKKDDAVKFFEKALDFTDKNKMRVKIEGNYVISLLENEQYEAAEKLICRLIQENPCNQNFSNYAELLKRQGRLEEALEWGKKALFLIEDDTTLLVVADIYKRLTQYDNAIQLYQKCLVHINAGENVYIFDDVNESQIYSIVSSNSLNMMLHDTMKGIISAFSLQKDYENAKVYLKIAEEQLPGKSEWEIWEQTLPEIEITRKKYEEIKEQLSEVNHYSVSQKDFVRQWALKLMQLQDNSRQLNLDEDDDWAKYEMEMDKILNEMIQIVNKESIVYKDTEIWVNSTYTQLDPVAREFLITAETLYDIHKSSIIDFAPIIIEYCKVVEKQLRMLLGSRIPKNVKMLGEIIQTITSQNIIPYNGYLSALNKVNNLRKKSAHTGVLGKREADKIRGIFYTDNLLNNLV